jgi:hypothetical protein
MKNLLVLALASGALVQASGISRQAGFSDVTTDTTDVPVATSTATVPESTTVDVGTSTTGEAIQTDTETQTPTGPVGTISNLPTTTAAPNGTGGVPTTTSPPITAAAAVNGLAVSGILGSLVVVIAALL